MAQPLLGTWHLGFGAPDDEHWAPVRGLDFDRRLPYGSHTCG
jgi:hypothetical protein